ncbi:MAG TPA: alpha/beta hydrolase [Acidimicrobiaceae bacterium]|nr:alpha/beta hydrolase [Acidimicrobiaceae bacterium]
MEPNQGSVRANDLDFAFLELGSGPLALCLHGFPDTPHGWRHQLPVLAEAGYRAVAPWMRGYAPTGIPADGCYQQGALAADANALHEALGGDGDAVLIGHDWGATAVYPAVNHEPDRWMAMVAAAVPHPVAMAGMIFDYDQLKRSFYMFVFQHPLAEAIVQQDDLAFIDRLWADWSPGLDEGVAATAVQHVKDALRDPDHLTAALGYYRATLGGVGLDPRYDEIQAAGAAPVEIPALYLHGADDGCIGTDFAEASAGFLTDERSRTTVVEGAGHFLQLERPERVNAEILDFLAAVAR